MTSSPVVMVKQVADTAAQQAERTFRQNSRRDHITHHLIAEQARRRRWLCQQRHAGEQGAGRFSPQSPAWEIKGVDEGLPHRAAASADGSLGNFQLWSGAPACCQ